MQIRVTDENTITEAALDQMSTTADPRLKEIMDSLVRHLHAFAREVDLKPEEWLDGIKFLSTVGQWCTPVRQEFILLSDVMGISMLVDLLAHARPAAATESTVFGPFHREGAPDLPAGGNIAHLDKDGEPTIVKGRVLSLDGQPIENALLDVWQTASNGLYDSQDANLNELHMRGKFRTDAQGRYEFRTTRPVHYQIPSDGPVGGMLRATSRHAWRPAHIHFAVSAEGYEPVITHIFDSSDPYLKSDAVFAVKESLVREFGPTVEFDFRLAPL